MKSITDYANNSADEITDFASSIMAYHSDLNAQHHSRVLYTCPIQLDNYYYEKALRDAGTANATLLNAIKQLRAASEAVDSKCKALDTYHKLEDYKQDNYEGARKLVFESSALIDDYRMAQDRLSSELEKVQGKIPVHSYTVTSNLMRAELKRERAFLESWKFNLEEGTHTGWNTSALMKSIAETDESIKKMQQLKPALNYPASSMWPSFIEGLQSILETKRVGLDEYNYEAKKSDKHSNDVYMSLINYYNGVLVSDYNTFLGFASGDKFIAIPSLKFVPAVEIRKQKQLDDVKIVPFDNSPFQFPSVKKQNAAISKPVFKSLSAYIEYINETYRQVRLQMDVIRNLNSSISYYSTLTNYSGKGKLSFAHQDFEVPLSAYQKALTESKVLPKEFADPLNKQSSILLEMMKELDQIGAAIEKHTSEKTYESDQCAYLYQLVNRCKVIFDSWDLRKEDLFEELRSVFDAYSVADTRNSWQLSGDALWKLVVLDKDALFNAKNFYKAGNPSSVSTTAIDAQLRDVISKEYDNMKGIEKYGRNNGLCPYTPYEDLPQNSKTLSEAIKKLLPAKPGQYGYQHPYHSMVYVYNEVVSNYNKFSSLSPVSLLPVVYQPELFVVQYPESKNASTPSGSPQADVPPGPSKDKPVEPSQVTIRNAVPKATLVHDTIYIEKRDTVYLHDSEVNLRSMEGYATNNMVLLLDVSGSMNTKDKLPLLKTAVLDILSMMRNEDRISIITFSDKPKVLLQNVSFKDEEKIKKAIKDLKPAGTTDGNAGLKLAYKVADENYIRAGNNRIILATDGEFSLHGETKDLVSSFSGQDIYLSVFSFSKTAAKSLQDLTTTGKGNFQLITADNVNTNLIREAKAKKKR